MIIAFDVDGTLATYSDKPRLDIIEMLRTLSKYHTIIVWSGGGKSYAEQWVRRLYLDEYVSACYTKPMGRRDKTIMIGKMEMDSKKYVDISFDDENVDIAKINIQIKEL